MSIISSLFDRTIGASSPLASIVSEANSEEKMAFEIMNLSATRTRFRMIENHAKFSRDFSRSNIVVSEYVHRLAEHLVNVFFSSTGSFITSNSFAERVDSIVNSDLNLAEVKASHFLQQALNIKAAAVAIPADQVDREMIKAVSALIHFNANDVSKFRSEHMDFTWEAGFFNFANKNSMTVTLYIPKEYLKQTVYDAFLQNPKQQSDTNYDYIETIRDHTRSVLVSDILMAFVTAAYREAHALEQMSDIMTVMELVGSEAPTFLPKFRLPNLLESQKSQLKFSLIDEVYAKNVDKIQKHFSRQILTNGNIVTDTVASMSIATGKALNPINVYNILFEIGYRETTSVFEKILGLANLPTSFSEKSHTIRLKDIQKFAEDPKSALMVMHHVARLLPLVLYLTYYADNGSKHAKVLRFMDTLGMMISSAKQIGSTYTHYRLPMNNIISSIEFLVRSVYEQAKDMQVVNYDSKVIIFNAILRSMSDGAVIS